MFGSMINTSLRYIFYVLLSQCFILMIYSPVLTKDSVVYSIQKQPSRGVPSKRCSENMQQSNFIEITLPHGCSPVNLLHIFRTPFTKNTSGWLLLSICFIIQVSGDCRNWACKKCWNNIKGNDILKVLCAMISSMFVRNKA